MNPNFTIRSASRLVGIKHDTGCKLLRRLGIERKCRKCGKPISGKRFWFCSDACHAWIERAKAKRIVQPGEPLFDGTANFLRNMTNFGCEWHVKLAFDVASQISELNAADLVGPCYEGIAAACAAGVRDRDELVEMAMRSMKEHWSQTKTFRVQSLDIIKDRCGWEPSA